VQEVTPPIRNSTWVKGILGIVESVDAGSNMWGAKSTPTNQELI